MPDRSLVPERTARAQANRRSACPATGKLSIMPLVLVTGISGSGKSAVCAELKRRAYEAHDTDQDGNAVWVNRKTGEVTAMSAAPNVKSAEWLDEQAWSVVPERVEALAERAIDSQTLRHRVESRTDNDFGKAPSELEAILSWRNIGEDQYRQFGAVVVDATRPLHQVVSEVLEASI
jgi:hypothetical protein